MRNNWCTAVIHAGDDNIVCIQKVAHSGGCTIGTRPIDLHIEAFSSLGIEFDNIFETSELIQYKNDGLIRASGNIKGGNVILKYPSVGATENLMIGASACKEKTLIINAACEPEIIDLQN